MHYITKSTASFIKKTQQQNKPQISYTPMLLKSL